MTVAGRMLTPVDRLAIAQCLLVRALPCGCRVGLYRTWDAKALTIVDEPDDECRDRAHQADFVIDERAAGRTHGEAA